MNYNSQIISRSPKKGIGSLRKKIQNICEHQGTRTGFELVLELNKPKDQGSSPLNLSLTALQQ
jgi:hypothetical protein